MQIQQTAASPSSPFHTGEQAVQSRLGVRDAIEPWARQVVRPILPDQHREFYRRLPFVVAAARDADGRPWVTLLVGPPGFVQSPGPRHLHLITRPFSGDALEGSLLAGAELGLLGIELETRRRNRVNGSIVESGDGGLSLSVAQAFGNCPQYITERAWHHVEVDPARASSSRHRRLEADMQSWIRTADTFFIASGFHGGGDHPAFGMDASHRGGAPGFVKVENDARLVFPDYAGNNHFNTIGNLVEDPRVGLLFVDFERGSLLQLTGTATIDWDSDEVARHPGAQRLVIVDVEDIVCLDGVLPLRWSAPKGSIRSLKLIEKIRESEDVTSFVFTARDGGELPDFEAGQYLPLELRVDGHQQPSKRTYSLSNGPGTGSYRISVKREPLGLVSRHLHDSLEIGAIVSSSRPEGEFILQPSSRPVVLISAGIGVTPMVSMLHALSREQSERPVLFVHGARDGAHHPLADEVRELVERGENIRHRVAYSQPRDEDIEGRDFHLRGRVDVEFISDALPALDGEFYLCGPTRFLAGLSAQLSDRGVPPSRIHTETFGPSP